MFLHFSVAKLLTGWVKPFHRQTYTQSPPPPPTHTHTQKKEKKMQSCFLLLAEMFHLISLQEKSLSVLQCNDRPFSICYTCKDDIVEEKSVVLKCL